MNAVITGIAVAYIAFSCVCLIAAIAAYFDFGFPRLRRSERARE